MSDAALRADGSLEAQPRMGVRNLHNFIYCPRLFYFQWVENIFQENADTVAGSHVHRNVDAPSQLEDPKELGLPEGAKLRSLRLESESLGLIGAATAPGQVPQAAKECRLAELQALLRAQQVRFNAACVGLTLPVLFTGPGRHPGQIAGRSPFLQPVLSSGPSNVIGQEISVQIVAALPNSLSGSFTEERASA